MGERLKGKVAIITGSGSGMGRLASVLFAEEGARVVVNDVVAQAGQETAAEIRDRGGEAFFHQADVAREAEVAALVETATNTYGRLDVLYNNAGIFLQDDTSVVDTPEAVWDRVQSVNLKSMFLTSKYAVPPMVAAGGGSIINIASFVALVGCTVPQDAYTASKGGVIALTKSLAVQYGRHGIRANAICPGPIETPMLTSWLLANPEARQVRLNRIPLARFGRPEDIVYLAMYLASDESSWTTGAVLVVDGGITSNYF